MGCREDCRALPEAQSAARTHLSLLALVHHLGGFVLQRCQLCCQVFHLLLIFFHLLLRALQSLLGFLQVPAQGQGSLCTSHQAQKTQLIQE